MSEFEGLADQLELVEVQMCRLCLNVSAVHVNLFTNSLVPMIEDLTSITMKPDDDFPKYACLKCASQLKSAYVIKRRIIQSQIALTSNCTDNTPIQQTQNEKCSMVHSTLINTLNTLYERVCKKSTAAEKTDNENIINRVEKEEAIETSPKHATLTKEEAWKKIRQLKLSIAKSCLERLKSPKLVPVLNHTSQSNIKLLEKVINKKPKATKAPLDCNLCQLKFPNSLKYNRHMNKHKNKLCPICNKMIRSEYLKKHMGLHDALPAICEICGVTRKNQNSLRMHSFYYHKQGMIPCKDCGKTFLTKTKLLYHQRKVHTRERNFKCETCGKGFFAKIYLTKHISMRHMKLRPEICEYCGKSFSGKHALRTHIRRHTNETPFQCNYCNESFRQRVSLRGHLRSQHKIEEESNAFCEVCGKGFATEVALEIHMRLHSQVKCQLCSDSFADESYLDQHVREVHSSNYT